MGLGIVRTVSKFVSLDPERAKKFYQEAIGLAAAPLEGASFPYTVWL